MLKLNIVKFCFEELNVKSRVTHVRNSAESNNTRI